MISILKLNLLTLWMDGVWGFGMSQDDKIQYMQELG
jgi:hypothetical protein